MPVLSFLRGSVPAGARLRPLLLAALLLPAACDTPAERAEAHYQRALALLQAGDAPRAMLEFRNVFRLDPTHAAARLRYAEVLRDDGQTNEALSQLLRLTEQEPKNSWPSGRR